MVQKIFEKMKKIIVLFSFIGICGSLFSQNIQGDNAKIMNYVRDNYAEILEQIPEGKENMFGFENREAFKNCEIGIPINVLRIVNEVEVEKTNSWRIPLVINGKYIILLTVSAVNQNYEIVDVGGRLLAERIDNYNNADKKIAFLLRDYRNNTDYVSFECDLLSCNHFYKIQYEAESIDAETEGISLEDILNTQQTNK